MIYYCKLCDETVSLKTKYKHFKSKKHNSLEGFLKTRYIVENPYITQLNEILHNYIDTHNKKYNIYQIRCVSKVNDIQYLTCKPMSKLDYITYPYITNKSQPFIFKLLEMRITFSSRRHMKYDYYLKQPMPMCEIKLTQSLHKNPQVINSLNRFIIYPFIQEYVRISVGETYVI